MKRFFRFVVYHVFALWFVNAVIPSLAISGNLWGMLSAGLVLTMMMLLVKPLLSLIFFPINVLTLGLFGWFVNVIVLYLWTVLVPNVHLSPWVFPGISSAGFIIPEIQLSYTWTLIVISFLITVIVTALSKVNED